MRDELIIVSLYHQETEEEKKKRIAEEMGDAMKSLENRTLDSKREMDILATLDEMKSMKVLVVRMYQLYPVPKPAVDSITEFC